jgi:hypothetical protein
MVFLLENHEPTTSEGRNRVAEVEMDGTKPSKPFENEEGSIEKLK